MLRMRSFLELVLAAGVVHACASSNVSLEDVRRVVRMIDDDG